MAHEALIIFLLATAACLFQSTGGLKLCVTSTTNVKDGNGEVVAVCNVTIEACYNRTSDLAVLNDFVQNQFTKLQKSPELLAESDAFGWRRPPPPPPPPPPRPPGGLVWSYNQALSTKLDIGPKTNGTIELHMSTNIYTRQGKDHEALFAIRAPNF